MRPEELDGAGVVVTGAGHGIGRAIAQRMAAQGAHVVVNDLDADAAHRVADEIGGGAAVPGAPQARKASSRSSPPPATTTAGSTCSSPTPASTSARALDAPAEDWARAIDVNVMGHVRAAQQLVPTS